MATLEGLKRKLDSTEDLRSVVKTMKAMAAVNIRQFEKAVAALKAYTRTVELGLQAVLHSRPGFAATAEPSTGNEPFGAVVFGTDQGMCGSINEVIVSHALEAAGRLGEAGGPIPFIAVGVRAANRLEDAGRRVHRTYSVPGSANALTPLVEALLVDIETWVDRDDLKRVRLFHCTPKSAAAYRPREMRLLPVDPAWLNELRERPWSGGGLPWLPMDEEALFSALIRQHLFGALFRAAAESLAAENASRLAAMQGAESSIEEHLEDLERQYHRARQTGITEELLDIVSGFEALEAGD